jgi:hypothetical protein
MIGTFYRRTAPDKPALADVGQAVAPGKVLCIIEAMPVDNEVSMDAVDVPPIDIKVSEIECGDDLTDGILAVDGARFLLSKLKNNLKGV